MQIHKWMLNVGINREVVLQEEVLLPVSMHHIHEPKDHDSKKGQEAPC